MRNQFETTIKVKRIEICDLMIACLAAAQAANDGGEKWYKLHDKLQAQLTELDAQLDEVVNG